MHLNLSHALHFSYEKLEESIEANFNLKEESAWNYVDGEEGDSGTVAYYKDGKLFAVYINYAGDIVDTKLTAYGIECVLEYLKSDLTAILGFFSPVTEDELVGINRELASDD